MRNKSGILCYAVFFFVLLLFSSCLSYYQKNSVLMDAVYVGNFESANKLLADDAKWEKVERNRLLFYLNKGTVLWMQGNAAESNTYFGKADLFIEDRKAGLEDAALTMLVNANYSTYLGENFEQIMLHYFGSLNYLQLGMEDDALVEAKRMIEKMQRITDRYKSNNKYKRDAFAHLLLGLIYDARKEYNDAFIAYKNAYEVYKEDYGTLLNTQVPNQLKLDILRTAKTIGFYDEVIFYEKEFGMKAPVLNKDYGQVVCFWNNGMGPVKDQNSINIAILPLDKSHVQFVNLELGISIPLKVDEKKDRDDFLDMNFIRIAFPKYVERPARFKSAQILADSINYPFELAENINSIAFKSLADRMGREVALALGRVAMKQLAVFQMKKNKDAAALGVAAAIYGAVSEQADTRNWQLLPYSIHYSRISLPEGKHKLHFQAFEESNNAPIQKNLEIEVKVGKTRFLPIQTPDIAKAHTSR